MACDIAVFTKNTLQSGLRQLYSHFIALEKFFNIKMSSMDYAVFSDHNMMCCGHKEDLTCSTGHEFAALSDGPNCGCITAQKCVDEPSVVGWPQEGKTLYDHYEVMEFTYIDVDIGLRGSAGPRDFDTIKGDICSSPKYIDVGLRSSEVMDGCSFWMDALCGDVQPETKDNVCVQVGPKDRDKPQVKFDPGSMSVFAHCRQNNNLISVNLIIFILIFACFTGSCQGATPIMPNQPLPDSCIKMMADEHYDCPDFQNMNEIGTDFQMPYQKLNDTCCAGFTPGHDFHCQVVSIDGVSHSMFGCMKSKWVPKDCTGRIKNYNTSSPYFEVLKLPPTQYHREERHSYMVRYPDYSAEKSKCTDDGMEQFCHGSDSDNMCTCREGFSPRKKFAFSDDMSDYCTIMKCHQGLCPARHFPSIYTGPAMDCNKINFSSDLYNFTCEQCPAILPNSTEQPEHDISSLTWTGVTQKDLGFDYERARFLFLISGFLTFILVIMFTIAKFWDRIKEKFKSIHHRGYNFIHQVNEQPDMNTV